MLTSYAEAFRAGKGGSKQKRDSKEEEGVCWVLTDLDKVVFCLASMNTRQYTTIDLSNGR